LRNLISSKLQSSNGREESEETPLSVINDKSLDIATSLKWEGRSFIGDDKSSSDNDGDQSKETPLSIINGNNHPNVIKEDPVAIINDKPDQVERKLLSPWCAKIPHPCGI
jgi:hypothetical protein